MGRVDTLSSSACLPSLVVQTSTVCSICCQTTFVVWFGGSQLLWLPPELTWILNTERNTPDKSMLDSDNLPKTWLVIELVSVVMSWWPTVQKEGHSRQPGRHRGRQSRGRTNQQVCGLPGGHSHNLNGVRVHYCHNLPYPRVKSSRKQRFPRAKSREETSRQLKLRLDSFKTTLEVLSPI